MAYTTTRRGFLSTLAGVSGTVFLAACSSAPPAQAPATGGTSAPAGAPQQAPANAGQKVTLRVMERANNIVEGGPQFELYRTHAEAWKAAHPNVDLKVESLPTGSDDATKLLSLHMCVCVPHMTSSV